MSTFLNRTHVYGPVHSRRLGLSLGVNMNSLDGKHCTFDCIYCELGTNELRHTATPFPKAEEIARALEERLAELACDGTVPGAITLAGNGEPTENPEFPEMVERARALRDRFCPKAKIAVLSNATFAAVPKVQEALEQVDMNILKLDSVDPEFIRLVDRPHIPYDAEAVIDAIASFKGHAIVQTIFLTGDVEGVHIDDTVPELVDPWLDALARIKPEEAMIYTIARETALPGLQKAAPEVLDAIAAKVEKLGIPCEVAY